MTLPKPLVLRFGGSLVEQLGAQLYPSATATVAELISNAWDADAKTVWITIPFDAAWATDSKIVFLDDGHGMDRVEAQTAYLVVGRKRRLAHGDMSPNGRKVHGRKGIGKLAAFGTAKILDCLTVSTKGSSHFRLDYDEIRKLPPTADYDVKELPLEPLNDPDGKCLTHGTRVTLSSLFLRRRLPQEQFRRSMSRRFAISQTEMKVFINGKSLERFDMDVQLRFPRDGVPEGVNVANDGWAEEDIDGKPVRWWIGFTASPLTDDSLQGVSILARGKMAQRPFKFERAQGTEGQLGQEYLVGEVVADWLDIGVDIEDDLIQSNRDQLQLEDTRLNPLMEWGRRRLAWALRERNRLRRDMNLEKYERDGELDELLAGYTKAEKNRYLSVARVVSKLPEIGPDDVVEMMRGVIDAQSDVAVRQMMENIAELDDPLQAEMWRLVRNFGLIDARRNATLIEARLKTIETLERAVRTGATEVPHIHEIVRRDPWLIDPRWHLLDDELDIATLGVEFEPALDEEGQRMDFLFALAPRPPALVDEVIVVEIKRGTHADRTVRKVNEAEIEKFIGYVAAVQDHYARNTRPPKIRGLMVAQDYNKRADLKRRMYEKIPEPRVEFKTWERVIQETQRMHTGWLHVSRRRAAETLVDDEV